MENTELILLAIAGVIGIIIIWRLMKTLFKVVIIAALLLGAYLFFSGGSLPFGGGEGKINGEKLLENMTISQLVEKHCAPGKENSLKCKCWITPVYNDLNLRYTKAELVQIEGDRTRMAQELKTSYSNKKTEINACMGEKKDNVVTWFGKAKNTVNSIVDLFN